MEPREYHDALRLRLRQCWQVVVGQPVKSSSGGGFRFEDLVGAYVAAAMLAGKPVHDPEWGPPIRVDFQVGADGWRLDDILVTFQLGDGHLRWAGSIKSFAYITGRAPRGFVEAAWADVTSEVRPDFDRARDHVGVVVASLDPQVSAHLRELVRLAREQGAEDLARRMKTSSQGAAILRLWESFGPDPLARLPTGVSQSPAEILGRFRHLELDLDRPNSTALAIALGWCEEVLAPVDAERARELWAALLQEVAITRTAGGYLDRSRLISRLPATLTLREIAQSRVEAVTQRLLERSHSRLTEGWRALGLDDQLADQLAADPTVGRPSFELPATGVVAIEGDWGAGKSVAAERIHQSDVTTFQRQDHAAIPAFLRAREVTGGLEQAVTTAVAGLGDAEEQGVTVVVDGLDEVGFARGTALLSDARVLATTMPSSRVVITSRPGFPFRDQELRKLGQLSDLDLESLSERITGRRFALWGLPSPVQDAVRRPLFAIVVVSRQARRAALPSTPALLLQELVETALGGQYFDVMSATELLARAARHTVESGGEARVADLGGPDIEAELLATRLVVRGRAGIRFALPILEQYFGAYALLRGHVDTSAILEGLEGFERWRYAFAVALAVGNWDQSAELLDAVGERWPGAAAWLVRHAVSDRGTVGSAPPAARISAKQLAHGLGRWLHWLDPMASLTHLGRDGGSRPWPVGTATSEGRLMAGLIRDPGLSGEVGELDLRTHHPFAPASDPEVAPCRFGAPPPDEAAWPWRWTLDWVDSSVVSALERRALTLADGPLAEERAWSLARLLVGESSLIHEPIPADQVGARACETLERNPRADGFSFSRCPAIFERSELVALAELAKQRATPFTRPWLPPDNLDDPSGWVWGLYTTNTMRRLVEDVYGAAFSGYRDLVRRWFPTWAATLGWASVMPIRLEIEFWPPQGPTLGSGPGVVIWPVPLDRGDEPGVVVRQVDQYIGRQAGEDEKLQKLHARMLELHPSAGGWSRVSVTNSMVDLWGDTPATDLAYDWLGRDLQELGLIERSPR